MSAMNVCQLAILQDDVILATTEWNRYPVQDGMEL